MAVGAPETRTDTPSDEQSTERRGFTLPSSVVRHVSCGASQIFAVESIEAVATSLSPVALAQQRLFTQSVCPFKVVVAAGFETDHSLAVPSSLAVPRRVPRGEKAQLSTGS